MVLGPVGTGVLTRGKILHRPGRETAILRSQKSPQALSGFLAESQACRGGVRLYFAKMPRNTPTLLWLGCLLGLLCLSTPGKGANDDEVAAWELLSRHLPADALARLHAPHAGSGREGAFAEAVVIMDSQPVTDARLQGVMQRLADLAQGDDEIAQASSYLIGRLFQVHFFEPDYVRAAHQYELLADKHPDGYWAQLGLVKLALLVVYLLPEPAEPAARIKAAEELLPRVKVPELQRDLHIVIGRAGLFHGRPVTEVLAHLLAADQIGGLLGIPRADLQLQIAELSRRAGGFDRAEVYFRRFIEENDVDTRVYAVRMKLQEMAEQPRAGEAVSP